MEKTINEVFRNRVAKYQNRLAIEKKRNGVWEQATWKEYYDRARSTGLGLYELGVGKDDRVALLADNRLEWLYTDMGGLGIGACIVPIYATVTREDVRHIAENSGAKVLIIEDRLHLEKALFALARCPELKHIVVMETEGVDLRQDSLMAFEALLESGRQAHQRDGALFERLSAAVGPRDLATIVYTPGTTGVPKGAMITHRNIMAVMHSLLQIRPQYADDTDHTVPFLPLSHVFERAAGHYFGMYVGITTHYCESIQTVLQDIQEKKPTIILAVPRICEKIYQKIIDQVQEQPPWRQAMFDWGKGVGAQISELREQKKPVPLLLQLQYQLAYFMILKKIHEALGGRLRWMTTSGAPISRDIVLFFHAVGVLVMEGYGMTECFAPAAISNLADFRIGSVGKPLPNVEIKLAKDGEILIKGDNVFHGYWKMKEETRECFSADKFFLSGDIGRFDEDGFLYITDRKKNLIITSGGKNIAPQKIEKLFMSDSLFSHFIVIGDNRKYLTALAAINLEQAAAAAEKLGIDFQQPEDLPESADFIEFVAQRIAECNTRLARYETIKQFRLLKNELTQEGGELTPSLKVRRKVVFEKNKDLIESMYQE